METPIDRDNVVKLFSKRSSMQVFLEALKEICPKKNKFKAHIVVAFITLLPSLIIVFSLDTVSSFINAVETFNSIVLGLFGIVFMGYSFFQALISDELLTRLLTSNLNTNDDKSKLQESNEYFTNVMMLHVISILINFFLIITIGSLESDFHLPMHHYINCSLALLGVWIYFIFSFLVVWEMKSFIFNSFQLFNAHAGARALNILKSNDQD